MPRSLPLNQFFVYLREQAAAAVRAREGVATPDQGGGVQPPSGFVFLIDYDGAYLTDQDGAYLMEAA